MRSTRKPGKRSFPHYTWGYIEKKDAVVLRYNVPSLYVRVYRILVLSSYYFRRSLTIREGISRCRVLFSIASAFPHYTWGYIAGSCCPSRFFLVPSLYVRVYRQARQRNGHRLRSLTIREGISSLAYTVPSVVEFPHYTWGYIDTGRIELLSVVVPSLYVRVYRDARTNWQPAGSSLTIREGISQDSFVVNLYGGFPHYTWGYIICRFPHLSFLGVPSLYVRVYRSSRCTIRQNPRSITIREGISLSLRETSLVSLFPHYTWGYIEKKCKKRRKNCVPSLYVRVYWSFSLLSESLILKM